MSSKLPETPNVVIDPLKVLHDLKNCVYGFEKAYELLGETPDDKTAADGIFKLAKEEFSALAKLIEGVPRRSIT
jgi:hypothetical protein